MGKRRKYDYEFQLRCVELVLKGEGSAKSIAKESCISIPIFGYG